MIESPPIRRRGAASPSTATANPVLMAKPANFIGILRVGNLAGRLCPGGDRGAACPRAPRMNIIDTDRGCIFVSGAGGSE